MIILLSNNFSQDQQKKCIHSFDDRNDSVFDVKWSPTNPALFASVDCTGNLDVWNINKLVCLL